MENVHFDQSYLIKMANTKMPFGRYSGTYIIDLPDTYLVWYQRKGFPEGTLGIMLQSVYEIQVNGLEYLFKPLRKS